MFNDRDAAPPPTPAREAPGNQSWKSNFLAINNGLEFLTGLDERLSAEDLPKYRDLSDALEAELIRRLLERYDGKLARLAGALQANRATLRKRLQGAE